MGGLFEVDVEHICLLVVIHPDLFFGRYPGGEAPAQRSSQCYLFLPRPYLFSPLELPHLAAQEGGDYKAIRSAHFLISHYYILPLFIFIMARSSSELPS